MFKKIIIFSFLFLSFFFVFSSVNADSVIKDTSIESPSSCGSNVVSEYCGDYQINDILYKVIWVLNFALGIVGALTLIYFIYGGVLLLISAGNSETVKKGQTVIKNAVIGLIIVFLSYAIVTVTFTALGLEGVNINNSSWFTGGQFGDNFFEQ